MARLEGAIPGSEENLQGNGGWGCIDWSRLQHTAAWGDPEGHRVLVWLLLACTKGKGAHSRAGSSRSRPRKFSPPSLVCSHRDHLGWGPGHLCRDSQVVPALGSQAAGTGYKGPFLGLLARLHRGHPSAQSSSSGSRSGSSGTPPGPAPRSQSRSQSPPSWWRAAAQARPQWPAGAPPVGTEPLS